MNWFANLSIRYKIGAVAFVGAISLAVSVVVNNNLLKNVNNLLDTTIEDQMPIVEFLDELQAGFSDVQELYQDALLAKSHKSLLFADDTIRYLTEGIQDLELSDKKQQQDMSRLAELLKLYGKTMSVHVEMVLKGADVNSDEVYDGLAEADELREEYEFAQEEFIANWRNSFKQNFHAVQTSSDDILRAGISIFGAALFVLVIVSTLIINQIIRAINKSVVVADKIAGGDLDQEIIAASTDESGRLMESLRIMRDSLSSQQKESKHRDELQSALASLNEIMRGDQDIDSLATNIIEHLAGITNSCIGAFYIVNDNKLSLLASYAFNIRKSGDNSFEIGESIIGQCALERKTFIVTDLPKDYAQITSGTGHASPSNIIVFPIELDGQLLGVIELGSFHAYTNTELELVEKGREGVAIAVNSAENRVRMAEMLQQTRTQAEELTLQQEQMEQINSELEERSQALDKQKNEILQKNNELERSKKVLMDKSEALEASDRYKTQFLSTMSHELRTPLNSILILSQALIDNKKGNLSDKEVQHANVIHSSGTDLLSLINDILDLSKIEEGKLDLVLEESSLRDIADELTNRFEFVAGNKGLDFKVNVADDMPDTIVTDTHRLNQVLKNFISNSMKFTEKGGVYVDIHLPKPPFVPVQSMLTQKDAFVIGVRDTGIGIPQEKQDVIFEAFKQADGTTSRKYGGTGLGLTISRELASLLGGEISVYSEGEGKGSTFYMILPLDSSAYAGGEDIEVIAPEPKVEEPMGKPSSMADDDKAAILAMYEQAGDQSGTTSDGEMDLGNTAFSSAKKVDRILIVEDDEKFANILNDLIIEAGLSCDLVHCGNDALTYLEVYKPQAVILDLSLPDISGWEVLKQIKESKKARSVPVHVVSAMPEKVQATKKGAKDFTEKPVSQDDVAGLLSTIKDEIGNSFNSVLLVEDNVALHDAIVEQFKNRGIQLEVVADGESGLQKAKEEDFDCLIVDLMLPDMDGIDLLTQVRQLPNYTETPIIVFTAQEMSAEREFEISKYSDRVIIKSGQAMDRLVSTVRTFLGDVANTGEQEIVTPEKLAEAAIASASAAPDTATAAEETKSSSKSSLSDEEISALDVKVDYAEYKDGDLEGCKVLLVDDDIRNIYSLSSVLEINGMEVETAMSGQEALDKLNEKNDIEVILMDIMMPEMDGYEAIGHIRNDDKFSSYKEAPIIALTAKAMKEDRALCIKAGATDYLSKPVDTDKLNQLLVTWTKRAS